MQEELLKEYYWQIEKWDGEKIKVKPSNAQYIQNLIASGEGFIKTPTMTINVKDIKSFDQTDILFKDQKLLMEGAARAFHDPIIYERKSGKGYRESVVDCKWVKKSVTTRKWEKYYSMSPSYHKLGEDDNRVIVAFIVPTHEINYDLVTEVSDSEYAKLNARFV